MREFEPEKELFTLTLKLTNATLHNNSGGTFFLQPFLNSLLKKMLYIRKQSSSNSCIVCPF